MTVIHEPGADGIGAGAPAIDSEIEVTSAMTDAGIEAAQEYYLGEGSYNLTEECLRKVYVAMAAARPAPVLSAHQTDSGGQRFL
jgi:hypothetical protein